MVRLAVNVMLGKTLKEQGYAGGLWPEQGLVAIKAPVFSMSKLAGVDTYLGPEMKSTGEVMGIDTNFPAALAKALLAAELMLPRKGGVLLSIADRDKPEALPYHPPARPGRLPPLRHRGHRRHDPRPRHGGGTGHQAHQRGTPQRRRRHPGERVDCVINTAEGGGPAAMRDGFHIRRAATEKRIPCFTSLDTARAAVEALLSHGQTYTVQPLRLYLRSPQVRKDVPVA